jgi:hypothetical protein
MYSFPVCGSGAATRIGSYCVQHAEVSQLGVTLITQACDYNNARRLCNCLAQFDCADNPFSQPHRRIVENLNNSNAKLPLGNDAEMHGKRGRARAITGTENRSMERFIESASADLPMELHRPPATIQTPSTDLRVPVGELKEVFGGRSGFGG